MKISIIIPAKNEEETIGEVIAKAKNYGDEVLVVDGHSTDRTREIAQELGAKVILDNKISKGDGYKCGVKEAKGDIIVFIDADGSHEPADIPKLVQPIIEEQADLVVASRMLGGSEELHGTWDNFIRNTGSNLLVVFVNKKWKTNLTDIENGFRAIKKSVFLDLNLKRNDFVIEQEMVFNALKKGYRVKEAVSHEFSRKGGRSKLKTSQGFKFIWHFIVSLYWPWVK